MDLANMKFDGFSKHEVSCYQTTSKEYGTHMDFDVVPIFLFLADLQVFFALVERKTWAVCLFMDDLLCMKTVQKKGATMPQKLGCLQGDFQTNSLWFCNIFMDCWTKNGPKSLQAPIVAFEKLTSHNVIPLKKNQEHLSLF